MASGGHLNGGLEPLSPAQFRGHILETFEQVPDDVFGYVDEGSRRREVFAAGTCNSDTELVAIGIHSVRTRSVGPFLAQLSLRDTGKWELNRGIVVPFYQKGEATAFALEGSPYMVADADNLVRIAALARRVVYDAATTQLYQSLRAKHPTRPLGVLDMPYVSSKFLSKWGRGENRRTPLLNVPVLDRPPISDDTIGL